MGKIHPSFRYEIFCYDHRGRCYLRQQARDYVPLIPGLKVGKCARIRVFDLDGGKECYSFRRGA